MLYVDDLSVCYTNEKSKRRFIDTTATYKTGEIEALRTGSPIQFLGPDLEIPESTLFTLSQKTFISRLAEANPQEIMVGGTLTSDVNRIKTFLNRR